MYLAKKNSTGKDANKTVNLTEELQLVQSQSAVNEVMHSANIPAVSMMPADNAELLQMSPDLQMIPQSEAPSPTLSGAPQAQPPQTFTMPYEQGGSLSRSIFDSMMQSNFGVGRIYNASRTDQENILRSASGNSGLTFNPPGYAGWSPGSDSGIYTHIINAFRQFSQTFGGIPPVSEIGFFSMRYAYDHGTSRVVQEPTVPAAYGGNKLYIYELISTGVKNLPTERSTGSPSDIPLASSQQSIERFITHELGHGVVEIGITPPRGGTGSGAAPDAQLLNDYRRAVGWTLGSSPQLYDIGVPVVQAAIAAGRVPDAQYRINSLNWNQPGWIEQPISSYMASQPYEDFPEAIMAFVNQPSLLLSRSPARYRFMQQRALTLAPQFRQIATPPPRPGDYPVLSGSDAMG